MTAAVIFGCAGPTLMESEYTFFRDVDPLGFILFQRNCESPDQVRSLVRDLRGSVGRPEAPVLIDQEGGRVARLRPPTWRAAPAPGRIAAIATRDRTLALEAARLNASLMGRELAGLGITVDCAPVLDLHVSGAHAGVVGDRALGSDPDLVSALGRAICDGLLAGGVDPVIKHMPGHGRALVDSHHDLPRVEASLDELRQTDFVPFRRLADMRWGMTAHVVYAAIDSERPATTSSKVIAEIIRGEIGFDGLLVTDDLSMRALQGDLADRTRRALSAGCDLALHCTGRLDEMREVADAAGPVSDATARRVARLPKPSTPPPAMDVAAAEAHLNALMAVA
ncbi:MAG: beta-N-acetylhexosaminidase [Dongiaceae bacterium]